GQSRRWYEAPRHRVNWEDDGRAIKAAIVARYPYLRGKWTWVAKNAEWYGRPGVTWSYLTSGRFSARRLEPGANFDVYGYSPFPWAQASEIGRELVTELAVAEREIDRLVCDLYGLPQAPEPAGAEGTLWDDCELARRWISYAVGLELGRWAGGAEGMLRILP